LTPATRGGARAALWGRSWRVNQLVEAKAAGLARSRGTVSSARPWSCWAADA